MNIVKHTLLAFSILSLAACNDSEEPKVSNNMANDHIEEVRSEYIPDKRVALFNVEAVETDGKYILKGESNYPEAVTALKDRLKSENVTFEDSIQILPSKELGEKTYALVRTSVANIRSNPGHSSELATQATLGTPLKVLKQDGDWYLVQTPDKYLAWVDHGGITRLSKEEFSAWKAAEKVIYMDTFGQSYTEPSSDSGMVSDLVAGDILVKKADKNGFFEVQYPDGRLAYIERSKALDYEKWINSLEQSEDDLVATSKKLMGLPYLWGGTSSKGVDCSGFTKTIYFMNGMVIPRDASQQVHIGEVVDSTRNFENLKKGDLLFFGTPATDSTRERVVHVGMWIGDNKFIHSSGNVHISSMDKDSEDFDEFNYGRYLRTKRLLGTEDPEIMNLPKNGLFRHYSADSAAIEEIKQVLNP